MKFAFCLFNYFPYGGLQRDFLTIAKVCVARGHTVDVYTMSWEGAAEPGLNIRLIKAKGWQNHTRCRSFSKQVAEYLSTENYDCVVGFNRMPNLDIYYAADVCYQARARKKHHAWYRYLPRYRQQVAFEKSVFGPEHHTKILLISPLQQSEFVRCYKTPAERFYHLPPGINKNRIAPANAADIRAEMRHQFRVADDEHVLLLVGSGFKTKGLDRILLGLAALPQTVKNKTRLFVLGQDYQKSFQQQAQDLGIADQVRFLGGRDDVPAFLLAADLLVHPAYHENTGTVLLEAVVAGLPVLTVDVCGYAHYVEEVQAGVVLKSPFDQQEFNATLQAMLVSGERKSWSANGLAFAKHADIYSLHERAASVIASPKGEAIQSTAWIASSDSVLLAMTDQFNQYMALNGEKFRELEGRSTKRVLLEGKSYFIKQHFGIGWKEICKNLLQFRLPIISAKNEWRAIQKLQSANIDTPVIVAYGSRGMNPAKKRSFLLTEELSNVVSLEDYCKNWRQYPPTYLSKQKLIQQVARIARIMHQQGINHRDFYLCHFLLNPENKLYLIDLHRAQIRQTVPLRWRIKDLAGLYFSAKEIGLTSRDYYRFISYYCELPLRKILQSDPTLWQKVQQRGEKLYRKHQK